MEIQQNLFKYKLHIISASVLSLLAASLIYLAPRLLAILAYFWPLYLSTGLFLVAIVFFGKTSPLAADPDPCGDKAAKGLLDYVACQPPAVEADPPESFTSGQLEHETDD
ncbi:unnamed protein product [Linum tenue]|uniref:Transmembrane protein n=1 Tax=Linum tenue TaxID=586396 RepID=A0AAV0H2D5_9ROSI|nr:unnamed protein product [Linum tenue]